MITFQSLELAPDAVERWVQELDSQQARQALVGFGLWTPGSGAAPTDNLDAAYELAQCSLGISRQAITFRSDGHALICYFVYAGQLVKASAEPHALALTRAVLCAAYGAHLL